MLSIDRFPNRLSKRVGFKKIFSRDVCSQLEFVDIMMDSNDTHILIIGAGITGLILAQALKKASSPKAVLYGNRHR